MMFISMDNTGLDNRLYSVTGTFSLALRNPCFYRQSGWKSINYLPELNALRVFVAGVIRDFINPHRVNTTLIPIEPSPKQTASQLPAVSSLEAYQTPAR